MRALEVKLSQGAKPGLGGLLPAAKVSPEIAATRGIPAGHDCVSPARHSEFTSTDELLDWVEMLAAETGLPVGIKSAVGDIEFWIELADLMTGGDRGVDFVNIDGGEGGTGAVPAGVHRLGRAAVPARLQPGVPGLRRARAPRAGGVLSAPESSACPTTP